MDNHGQKIIGMINQIIAKIIFVMDVSGLSEKDCKRILIESDWDVDLTLWVIQHEQSLYGKENRVGDGLQRVGIQSTMGGVLAKEAIAEGTRNSAIYQELAGKLSTYNTMRGGTKGFKGFVFEELHAADATIHGTFTEVLGNNSIADFRIVSPEGVVEYAQAKVGYGTAKVDWSLYEGQSIVIDKGNTQLINNAKEAGMNVIESNIAEHEAKKLANKMQFERRFTGKEQSVIAPKLHSAGKVAQQCHQSGVSAAKKGAAFGAGFSIGSNVVELLDGEKELQEAVVDIAKDTVVATGVSYAVGATVTAVGSTATGAAIGSAAAATGAAVTSAVAGTTIGGAAIAAGTAVAGTAATAGAAVAGACATAGTAVASTAVGGAVATAATATGAAIASTAVGAAVTTAAVAAAPVVLAGAAIGGVVTLGKKLFGR